jgi:hypothetical protein
MSQVAKGPALLILLGVAVACIGLGIFLDNEVLPPSSDTNEILEGAVAKAARDTRASGSSQPANPSEVERQLRRAVEAANSTETEKQDVLEEKVAKSKTLIEETNRMLEEKGVSQAEPVANDKARAFNQKLSDLKAKLVELQPSR